jgi:hypothetical protein
VPKAATYSAHETLRDGRPVIIRALKPDDRSAMLSAVGCVSAQSLYRRFFGAKRGFTEKETDFFVNVDFVTHVALVAVINEGGAGHNHRSRTLYCRGARKSRGGLRDH